MKKRLVLRRQMGKIEPPKPYLFKNEMPRVQYIYFRYKPQCVSFILRLAFNVGVEDAGYCLDSQVDTEMRSQHVVDLCTSDFPRVYRSRVQVTDGNYGISGTIRKDSPANAFIGGSRSTVPRDPNYRPGSFGGGWNRAGRGRF